ERFRETFLRLHPSDHADIFMTIDKDTRSKVYTYLNAEEFADVFDSLDVRSDMVFFLALYEDYATAVFDTMFWDDVDNFLSAVNDQRAEEILERMDGKKAEKVYSILKYADETAGAIMTKELISISSTQTVGDVLDKLRDEAPDAEIVYYLYVVDPEG